MVVGQVHGLGVDRGVEQPAVERVGHQPAEERTCHPLDGLGPQHDHVRTQRLPLEVRRLKCAQQLGRRLGQRRHVECRPRVVVAVVAAVAILAAVVAVVVAILAAMAAAVAVVAVVAAVAVHARAHLRHSQLVPVHVQVEIVGIIAALAVLVHPVLSGRAHGHLSRAAPTAVLILAAAAIPVHDVNLLALAGRAGTGGLHLAFARRDAQ
mmetsp:Transcript_87052/g.246941  ORF Transcript_87052/g.246941 Transcript_87052/m.246941 type:complete len:209 (-) Transcript_87052:2706-3332(-)